MELETEKGLRVNIRDMEICRYVDCVPVAYSDYKVFCSKLIVVWLEQNKELQFVGVRRV